MKSNFKSLIMSNPYRNNILPTSIHQYAPRSKTSSAMPHPTDEENQQVDQKWERKKIYLPRQPSKTLSSLQLLLGPDNQMTRLNDLREMLAPHIEVIVPSLNGPYKTRPFIELRWLKDDLEGRRRSVSVERHLRWILGVQENISTVPIVRLARQLGQPLVPGQFIQSFQHPIPFNFQPAPGMYPVPYYIPVNLISGFSAASMNQNAAGFTAVLDLNAAGFAAPMNLNTDGHNCSTGSDETHNFYGTTTMQQELAYEINMEIEAAQQYLQEELAKSEELSCDADRKRPLSRARLRPIFDLGYRGQSTDSAGESDGIWY